MDNNQNIVICVNNETWTVNSGILMNFLRYYGKRINNPMCTTINDNSFKQLLFENNRGQYE